MKTDKPFQKGFICGMVLFIVVFLLLFIFVKNQELYFIKYARILVVSFIPAMFAAVWCFFSKKSWAWARFAIVTVIFCPIGLVLLIQCENFLPQETPSLPAITFSPKISSAWIVETGHPITDMNGKPIGSQLLLKNEDHRRMIWIDACNSIDDFDSNVERWKILITSRSIQSGFHMLENKFTVDMKSGQKVATIHLRVQKDDLTREIICQGWMQKRFFVTYEAEGQNIEIADDKDFADVISSIVIE
jgi:hypothetical protein